MTSYSKIEFEIENERLLEKLDNVKSFNGWKAVGKFVKKGQKQKAFRVQSGSRCVGHDPISGETVYAPVIKIAYGFTADQVS